MDFPSGQASVSPAGIYERATNQFALADFYKPAESKTNDPAFTLAPLILQEVKGAAGDCLSRSDSFGALSLSNGLWILDGSRPSVYWHADTVPLGVKSHARVAYWWFYSPRAARSESAPHLASPDRGARSFTVRGVRLTLNSAGQPAIWEVLGNTPGAELFFVAQSLEAAAAARFGKPLPGRRYAIEPSLEEAPSVFVARVVDDGPVAMGPTVYLSAGTHEVSTLICRCMPAQAKSLRTTATYDLLPLPAAIPGNLLSVTPDSWSGAAANSKPLENSLRLPAF